MLKNAAPTALAVMGIQLGYLLGGSILIETVFSWPGTGLLLNDAIFQRDLPLLQGTILVLALFFVVLNVVVDVLQTALDLKAAGFEPFVVVDAIASRVAESKEAALKRLAANGVEIVTTEMVIFEWLERAGTDDFRALLPLLK